MSGIHHFDVINRIDLDKTLLRAAAYWVFLHHLANNCAPVSAPVLAADGEKVVAVIQSKETFLATVTQALSGNLLPEEMLSDETFSPWGRALAQLHNAPRPSSPPTQIYFPLGWTYGWIFTSLSNQMITLP